MPDQLSTERWREIDRIFSAALDVPADELSSFLLASCGGNASLREAVESLLGEVDADTLMRTAGAAPEGVLGDLASDVARAEGLTAGESVGAYRIVRELGRGGMAVVYLAARADGAFEQQLALKLIKRGLDSVELVRRFLAERQILASLERAVCERAPTRPSTAVPQSSRKASREQSGDSTPTTRPAPVRPERLRKRLRGDVDDIVLKALRKVPAERYASVGQMVDDIERHLAGRPVSARAPSLHYLTRKLVGRHRLAVTAGVALIALSFLYTVRLAVERTLAQRAAAQAEQTVAALESVLGGFDPYAAEGGLVTVRDLLDSAMTKLHRELADQPEIEARLLTLLGNLYQRLGAFDPARSVPEKALALREAVYGSVLGAAGRPEDAIAPLERAVAICIEVYSERSPTTLRAAGELAEHLRAVGRSAEANGIYSRALEILESMLGAASPYLAATVLNLAESFEDLGDQTAARQHLSRAAVLIEDAGDMDPATREEVAAHLTALRVLDSAPDGAESTCAAHSRDERAFQPTITTRMEDRWWTKVPIQRWLPRM